MAVLLTKYRTIVDFRTENECHQTTPLKQKAFKKKVIQITKLNENHEKMPHPGIEPACITKTLCARSGTHVHSATMPSIFWSVITYTVLVIEPDKLVASKSQREILQNYKKYVFLKQNI